MFNFFEKLDSQIQRDVTNELKWNLSVTDNQIKKTLAPNGIIASGKSEIYV